MRVFISYSRIDSKIALDIAKILDTLHVPYFLDVKDIKWGDQFKKEIVNTLKGNITHFLVVVSPESLKSQWVGYEIGLANAHDIEILPYLVHPSLELPGVLATYDHISDLSEIKKYFCPDKIEKKYMTITNEDGSEEVVEVVFSFEFADTLKEYVIYTKNETDVYGEITVYVSAVDRSTGSVKLLGIDDDDEWERVQNVIEKLSKDE